MLKKIITLVLLFSSSIGMANDANQMSESERKLTVGLLYLSQCVYFSEDYSKLTELYDKKNDIKKVRKNENESQYIDEWAMTKVTLRKDVCAIEIKSKEMDKIAQRLPELLEISGGKLSLSKVAKGFWGKPGYKGELIQNGKPIIVKVDINPERDDIIFVALFNK